MDQASQEIMPATQSIQEELSKLSRKLTTLDVEEDVHWKTAFGCWQLFCLAMMGETLETTGKTDDCFQLLYQLTGCESTSWRKDQCHYMIISEEQKVRHCIKGYAYVKEDSGNLSAHIQSLGIIMCNGQCSGGRFTWRIAPLLVLGGWVHHLGVINNPVDTLL